MPFIQLNDKQFPLRTGDVRVGTGADADIRLPGPDCPEAQAVIVSVSRAGKLNEVSLKDVK